MIDVVRTPADQARDDETFWGSTTVFSVALTTDIGRLVDLESVRLDDNLSARRSRLRCASDRDDFTAARALVRRLLSTTRPSVGEDEWSISQQCATCGGPHGRPVVLGHTGLFVSWAHARGLVAAAVSDHDVGVDVEWCDPGLSPPLPQAVHPAGSLASWLGWTRMEALVKRGDGDLDAGLQWQLGGAAALDGIAVSEMLTGHPGVITDIVGPDNLWVASVAAATAARRLPLDPPGYPSRSQNRV